MTAIKQKAVTTAAHAANVARYLNDERALDRESQNIIDEDSWQLEMEQTREVAGHDKPSRVGAANTIMYHQVLAFNPDECSCNGGKMTPEACMKYAREYISSRYPNQEAVWVLHCEHCSADNTDRFAVHVAINRTDLETGLRLSEGRGQNAKIGRANAVRDMDRKWGLQQMREGERNSRVHARQPTYQEKAMAARGVRSDKQYLREAISASMIEARASAQPNKVRALADALKAKGVEMHVAKGGKSFMFCRQSTGFKVRSYKLGRGFSVSGIAFGLGIQGAKLMAQAMENEMEN